MKIEELIYSLGIAVQQAHNAISDESVDRFFTQHFESLQSGTDRIIYRPMMIEIALPRETEDSSSTTSKENTRQTDKTAKYEIYARAAQQPPAEGMAKLNSIFASVIEPITTGS